MKIDDEEQSEVKNTELHKTENKTPEAGTEEIKSEEVIREEKAEDSKGALFLVFIIIGIIVIGGLLVFIQRVQERNLVVDNSFESIYERTLLGYETENNYLYNGFVFIKNGDVWETRVDLAENDQQGAITGVPLFVHYGPRDLEQIEMEESTLEVFNNKNIIALTFDPNLGQYITLSGLEFAKVLVSFYGWPSNALEYGLLNASTSALYPEITCANHTANKAVVVFSVGDETSITKEEGCIKVIGENNEEVLRASNRFMLSIIGIMD